jgi:hypothetical protein
MRNLANFESYNIKVQMRYNSKRDPLYGVVFLIIIFVIMISVGSMFWADEDVPLIIIIPTCVFCFAVIGFIVWIWLNTYYEIQDGLLYYRSGPIKGKLPVKSIIKITQNQTMYAGTKPALARNGLIITYGKWNEIYISPILADELIRELKKINKGIILKK